MVRAAVFVETGQPLIVEEVTPTPVGPRDVVVRVAASGICHSDLSKMNGSSFSCPPAILGHEGVGIIEEVGREVRRFSAGDRVIGSLIPTCGTCWYCERGEPHLCQSGYELMRLPRATRADGTPLIAMIGAFAETMTLVEDSAVKVESDLPDVQLALIGCGVSTGVGAVLNTAAVEPGASVAVIGCGGVGQAVIQAARIVGAGPIIAIDPVLSKREQAVLFGATEAIDPEAVDAVALVQELTAGRGADYAFDVVGGAAPLRQAYEMTRPGGMTVAVGLQNVANDVAIPGTLVVQGKRISGCAYGGSSVRRDFPKLVAMVEGGKLDIESMVTKIIDLSDINDAFRAMENGEVIRSVIKM